MFDHRPVPDPRTEDQESVWDYPRPPRLEPTSEHVLVRLGGVVVVDTRRALRILETSHPPTYYLPISDVADGVLIPAAGQSYCEFKGHASYFDMKSGDRREEKVVWTYLTPSAGLESLVDHIALYPARMDEVTVDGERVRPQEGGFYGGWITSRVVGPFKGGPGSHGW